MTLELPKINSNKIGFKKGEIDKTILAEFPFPTESNSSDNTKNLNNTFTQDTNPLFSPSKNLILDGPPYANGNIHIGHALNKILKDIINRYNKTAPLKSRHDCHGLPIEHKIKSEKSSLKNTSTKDSSTKNTLTSAPINKDTSTSTNSPTDITNPPIESTSSLLSECYTYAKEQADKQFKDFQKLGINLQEENFYTLNNDFISKEIKVFAELVKNGYVYYGHKPTWYSCSSKTSLAEAELEYKNIDCNSAYIRFEIYNSINQSNKSNEFNQNNSDNSNPNNNNTRKLNTSNLKEYILIWTTTPWTIPSNVAIAYNKSLKYKKVYLTNNEVYLVHESFESKEFFNCEVEKEEIILSKDLPSSYINFNKDLVFIKGYQSISPLVEANYVTDNQGTGFVHIATAYGQEDHQLGLEYNLPIYDLLDENGNYSNECILSGEYALDNKAIIKLLSDKEFIYKIQVFNHSYPHDWRTNKPVITRLSKQWFINIEKMKPLLINQINEVDWSQPTFKNMITNMVENRNQDWCISRQRKWGVPIPVFFNKKTKEPLLDYRVILHISELFKLKGKEYWWETPIEELLPKNLDSSLYEKGEDIFDVWFDSGCLWTEGEILSDNPESSLEHYYQNELYVEGIDQHRGWFQSSLITSVGTQGIAPYKKVITHRFTVDADMKKMSKSKGNGVDPLSLPVELLRWWVANSDYTNDIIYSKKVFNEHQSTYTKIRNTYKFLLSNIADWDYKVTEVTSYLDLYILNELNELKIAFHSNMQNYDFKKAISNINLFINDLSNFYLDSIKDRLYVSKVDSNRRRSCQFILYILVKELNKLLECFIPWTIIEVNSYIKTTINIAGTSSIKTITNTPPVSSQTNSITHGETNIETNVEYNLEKYLTSNKIALVKQWYEQVKSIKDLVSKEKERLNKDISTKLDLQKAEVNLNINSSLLNPDNDIDNLEYILSCSKVTFNQPSFSINKLEGKTCKRCWNVKSELTELEICNRCNDYLFSK